MNDRPDQRYGRISCTNLNHRRSDAPVAHCPECGEVVNAGVGRRRCTEVEHAVARRARSVFCVHCGQKLVGASGPSAWS
jgi:ribosomal protein L37AE/L43A